MCQHRCIIAAYSPSLVVHSASIESAWGALELHFSSTSLKGSDRVEMAQHGSLTFVFVLKFGLITSRLFWVSWDSKAELAIIALLDCVRGFGSPESDKEGAGLAELLPTLSQQRTPLRYLVEIRWWPGRCWVERNSHRGWTACYHILYRC